MPTDDNELGVFADASAAFVGMTIPADCRPGVIANLRVLHAFAGTVLAVEVPPEFESLEPFAP